MNDKDSQFLCNLQTPFRPRRFQNISKDASADKFRAYLVKEKIPRPWVIDIGSGGKILRAADYSASVPSPPGGLVPPVESPPEGVLPPVV